MQISTTCPYCGVGCGVTVHKQTDGAAPLVLASQTHPANFGRVCSKGSTLGETLDARYTPQRLTHPTIGGKPVSWEMATAKIAERLQSSIDQHGVDSVAFYLSGQLLTEDYYVANKLAKGFLGTANVDTNSRLCMSSAVAGYKRAFGSDTVPCNYEDLELADLIVLIGSNAAWTHPVLYQRMVAAKQANPALKIVLVDPRKTATADLADLHLAITPSSDNFLFQGLLHFLAAEKGCDETYIAKYTQGFEHAIEQANDYDIQTVAELCDVDTADLRTFYQWFADTKKAVSFYSQGINQSATGTDKCNAIINCHLATGKIGYEGAGPFSITGQPNAMGGREVGGLANMLAAHMDFTPESIDRVQRFWQAPNMATQPGLKAVDLFDAVEQGKIKVLWIMATNPAVSLPESDRIRKALSQCETVIVSDITNTDTTEYADIVLPALGWGEKDGTVTNSERRISRQRGFSERPGLAKPDWWAVSEVGKQLGFERAFDFNSPSDVFSEHAALSGFENGEADSSNNSIWVKRDFDISALANLSPDEYDDLQPIQWPVNKANPNGTARMFEEGHFFTPSGKAQFVTSRPALADAVSRAKADGALLLNSGRLRDQWHTMTRTGNAPSLNAHDDVAFVLVNPVDALRRGLKHNAIANIVNEQGQAHLQVKVSDNVNIGNLFSPIHWNQQFASLSTTNALVPSIVDAVSGQPELKAAAVDASPLLLKSWARVVSKLPLPNVECFDYWCVNKFASGYVTLVGFNQEIDWRAVFTSDSPDFKNGPPPEVIEYANPLQVASGLILCKDQRIEAMVFTRDCASTLPGRTWLVNLFEQDDPQAAAKELRGECGNVDELICACFGTTRKNIEQALDDGATSRLDLASRFGCGSKCGSCKPELNQLLVAHK